MLDDVNDKIEKLWELLGDHAEELERNIAVLKRWIKLKDLDGVGDVSSSTQMIAQADVCYTTIINILEDLKRSKTDLIV